MRLTKHKLQTTIYKYLRQIPFDFTVVIRFSMQDFALRAHSFGYVTMSLPQTGSTGSVEQSSWHSHRAVSLGKERHLALYSHLTSLQGSTEYNTVSLPLALFEEISLHINVHFLEKEPRKKIMIENERKTKKKFRAVYTTP